MDTNVQHEPIRELMLALAFMRRMLCDRDTVVPGHRRQMMPKDADQKLGGIEVERLGRVVNPVVHHYSAYA